MNDVYKQVLEKIEAVDPALGEAILKRALTIVGTTPEDVTPEEMQEAYDQHLEKTLKKYPPSREVKAVLNTIQAMNSELLAGRKEGRVSSSDTTLPPGFTTRVISLKALSIQVTFLSAKPIVAQSNKSSGNGSFKISPRTSSIRFPSGGLMSLPLALSNISGQKSTPTMLVL